MKRGRRLLLLYSVMCLILFVYNPVFVNLAEHYLLHGDRVVVRVFQLLPIMLTEAYVFATITATIAEKSKILALGFTVAIASLLLFFGVTPWNREKVGYGAGMYVLPENAYKIQQEHIDICDAILNDMDGNKYGCDELFVDSPNYQILAYTPAN